MKLLYHLYLNYTGYSCSGQEYIRAVRHVRPDIDIKVKFWNTGYVGVSKNRIQAFVSMEDKKSDGSERINIFHAVPERWSKPDKSVKNIGICVFETISVPKRWVEKMNSMDAIITASHFNKGVFITSGVKTPIHVVGHCFDRKDFNREIRPKGRYDKTTFFAMGTWKQRKNWLNLIRGFYEAFDKRDNVCLFIKTDHPEHLRQSVEYVKRTSKWRSKETAPIFADQKPVATFEEIPAIMKKGDIYVSTSLGEGFGYPGLHAMALGMPVITTRFGGVLEYAKTEHCMYFEPSKYDRVPKMDNFSQFKNAIWPVLTVQEIAKKLRESLSYPQDKVNKAYNYVHEYFNYDNIGNKFCKVLES